MIKGFIPISFVDWPGHTTAVLFLGGCNLDCPYCHNKQVAQEPATMPDLSLEDVIRQIRQNYRWLTGITITGGEPTIQDKLIPLLTALSSTGLPLKLDTNGTRCSVVKELLKNKLINYIAMDVKGDQPYYLNYLHAPFEAITSSIGYILASGIPYEFRTTLDGETPLANIGKLIKGAELWVLQPIQINGIRAKINAQKLLDESKPWAKNVIIR